MYTAGDLPSGSDNGGPGRGSENQNLLVLPLPCANVEGSTSNEEGSSNTDSKNNDNGVNEKPMEHELDWPNEESPDEPIREIPVEPPNYLIHAHEPFHEQRREPLIGSEHFLINNSLYDENECDFDATFAHNIAPRVCNNPLEGNAPPGERLRVDEDEGAFGMEMVFRGNNLEGVGAAARVERGGFNPIIVSYVASTTEAYMTRNGEIFCDFLSLRNPHIFELRSSEYAEAIRELCDIPLLAEAMTSHINCFMALMDRNLETAIHHQQALVDILHVLLNEQYEAGPAWTFPVMQTANYELQVVKEKATKANNAFEIRVQWAFIDPTRYLRKSGCPCQYLPNYINRRFRKN